MKCINCGHENDDTSKFCSQCGSELNRYGFDSENTDKEVNEVKKTPHTSSLVLGIIAICLSVMCFCLPIIPQVASIILAIIAIVKSIKDRCEEINGQCTGGLILGIISIVISGFWLICYIISFITGSMASYFEILIDPADYYWGEQLQIFLNSKI